jgi:GR25 family glycosyltransferase involved in LPS biosynthesis
MPSRELVIAACNDKDDIENLKLILKDYPDVKLTVYEKCGANDYDNLSLNNVGREQHTFAHHFASRYDDLADYTICSAGNFKRHPHRLEFIKKALKNTPSHFECFNGEKLRDLNEFTINEHENNKLHPADPKGLAKWSERHLGTHNPDATCCYFGMMVVPAASIRRRPKVDYENVKKALAFKDPEAGHYMERLLPVLYDSHHLVTNDDTNEAIHSNGSQDTLKTAQWRAEMLVLSLRNVVYKSSNVKSSNVMPVYVINLDTRTDRLQRVQEQTKKENIGFTRVKALTSDKVDDKIISREWQATLNSKYDTKQDPNAIVTLSDGERGCAGSHAHIWEMVQHETTPVCIMEDDVMLQKNFNHILKLAIDWVDNNSIENPILYLEHLVAEWKSKGDDLTTTHIIRPITYTWNTGAYMLWPSTVKTLLANLPMNEPVDVFLARLMYNGQINAFGPDPAIAYQFCNHCDGDIVHTFAPKVSE